MKLLIQPGKLFKNWTGQPLDRRFKASLKNAILNQIEKRRNRRRLIPSVSIANEFEPGQAAAQHLPTKQQLSGTLLDEFREFLRQQLGSQAVAVFDHRLEGRDTKELVGKDGITSYRIKLTVELAQYLDTARETEPFDSSLFEEDDETDAEEVEDMRKDDLRQCTRDLLLVEQAREWLLEN